MPINEIKTNEYECGHCGYKWINRVNGKDRPVPQNCAKCKRLNWNDPRQEISYYEVGLRRKIKGLSRLYNERYSYYSKDTYLICFPFDLPEKFLAIDPRPTIRELEKVLKPIGHDFSKRHNRYHVPDPTRPGVLKRAELYVQDPKRPDQMIWNDDNEWDKLMLKEMELRQQYMIEIMKSRGVDYDPEIRLKIQREKRTLKYNEFKAEPSPAFIEDYFEEIVGDGICYKCKKRRMIIVTNDSNVKVCKKCGTELSDKWTGVVYVNKGIKDTLSL